MYELKIIKNFSAAHQLKMVNKKCENLHGHNWKIEVHVKGNEVNKVGVLIDFSDLKKYLNQIIMEFDHKFLNELDYFKDNNPSSENIAKLITIKLQDLIEPTIQVSRVSVWESENACATFIVG